MALSRTLVELSGLLEGRAGVDLFAPGARERVRQQPEAAAILPRLQPIATSPEAAMVTILQALAIQRSEADAHRADLELVATLPVGAPGLARPTNQVIREMLRSPRSSVTIAGYEISNDEVIQRLIALARDGVDVTFICDRTRRSSDAIRALWPADLRPATLYEDQERDDALPYASMHSKTLLVDQRDLLITSANFTLHGLHANIELGIRVQGAIAAEVGKIVAHLIWSGTLVRVP
ncbi:MAG: hypothetical protein K8W52_21655 [Deltaproteobacteria bacterium]|nr:hypothetical protein [Deltaproteobacteria bacterium]